MSAMSPADASSVSTRSARRKYLFNNSVTQNEKNYRVILFHVFVWGVLHALLKVEEPD